MVTKWSWWSTYSWQCDTLQTGPCASSNNWEFLEWERHQNVWREGNFCCTNTLRGPGWCGPSQGWLWQDWGSNARSTMLCPWGPDYICLYYSIHINQHFAYLENPLKLFDNCPLLIHQLKVLQAKLMLLCDNIDRLVMLQGIFQQVKCQVSSSCNVSWRQSDSHPKILQDFLSC